MGHLLPSSSLPLPRGWPRRVRSAAVHAISLADLTFTKTLNWASDSLNPRLRPQVDHRYEFVGVRSVDALGPRADRKYESGPSALSLRRVLLGLQTVAELGPQLR